MNQPDRVILALALIGLALAGSVLWLHFSGPSDGVRLPVGEPTWQSDRVRVTSLATWPGGMRDGDLVVSVDGRTIAAWAHGLLTFGSPHPQWHVGQTIRYQVLRHGQPLTLAITLRHYPLADLLAQVWGRLGVALVSLVVAAFVFAGRPHERAAQSLFLGAAAVVAASSSDRSPTGRVWWWYVARKIRWKGWINWHIPGMGLSYVGLLTALKRANVLHGTR